MWFLGLAPGNREIVTEALRRAEDIGADRRKSLADYVSARTAGLTAQHITRWIARAFRE